jgi:signal transduction histidine kinase
MKRILVIEDNEADRVLYRRYLMQPLGAEPLELEEAASGEEGLALFAARPPDCVLLDYQLPDTNGLLLLTQLQALCPAHTLCVVMVTGRGSERLAVQALHNGALDYLVKQQFDPFMLRKTVWHAIERNEARQHAADFHGQLRTINQQLHTSLLDLTASQQLVQAQNQDLDNFVYAASHDLKQPINNLVGLFGELRRTATFHDTEEAVVLQLVEESLRDLSTTIHDLAAVVQEQRPPRDLACEPVALAEVLADVQLTLRPAWLATKGQLTVDFAALPTLHGVRSSLHTIMFNLLSNALKYRQPTRPLRVHLRTYEQGGCAVLEVQDNGLGIDLDRCGKELFHLFRRFHPEAAEGTGVGLFLVNRLVAGTGGHMQVDSQLDSGTTFRAHLPAGLALGNRAA